MNKNLKAALITILIVSGLIGLAYLIIKFTIIGAIILGALVVGAIFWAVKIGL